MRNIRYNTTTAKEYFARFICAGYTCLQAQHFKGSFYKGRVSNSTQLNRTDYRKFYPCLLILLRTARIQTLIAAERVVAAAT